MDITQTVETAVWQGILPLFYNILISVIIIFIGIIVGRICGRIADKVFQHTHADRLVKQGLNSKISVETYGGRWIAYIMYLVFIFTAISRFGVAAKVIWIGGLIVLAIAIVAGFLRLQDTLSNLVAGWEIRHRKTYSKGDWVSLHRTKAQIQMIGLTQIKTVTKRGDIIYIPASVKLGK